MKKKKNYKETINLPKINFPMKANLNVKEPLIIKKWTNYDLYNKLKNKKKKKFIIHDGPPYANGNIHMGHAYNKILKDIIIKYKILMNFNIKYIPGWDCHGLPIELKVLKKNKINIKNKNNINIFKKKCFIYVNKQIKNQKRSFIKLGILANWKKNYKTMDYKFISNTILTFQKIIKLNLVERKNKPTNWCTKCKSSLADAEIEFNNKKTITTYISFKIYKYKNIFKKIINIKEKNKKINLLIWTTTTWTIPGNCAITIHPKYKYSLVTNEKNNNIFILLKNKLNEFIKKTKINFKEINVIKGSFLKKKFIYHPISKIKIPIILDKNIDFYTGTGIVHIASEHGEEDYKISKNNNVKGINVINKNGTYIKYKYIKNIYKKNIWKSEKIIIDKLKKKKKLIFKEYIIHKYPHCWRHKIPIIIRSTPQWFINLDKNNLRKKLLLNIKNVNWIPKWGYKKIKKMIIDRPDWCISRQRIWGTPITIFINKKNKKMHPKTIYLMKKIANKIKYKGPNYWYETSIKKFLGKEHKKYKKVLDILDVWFDSGSTFFTVLNKKFKKKKYIDVCLEGSDQFRGWFMSLLIINVAINNYSPYKNVISHGFLINKKGEKMSKSLNNNISPEKIIKKFGAEIIRLWTSSTNFYNEIHISDEIILRNVESYRKIRNTIKFLISNLEEFIPKKNIISNKKILLIDKWIINITKITQKKIISLYKKYKFHKVTKKIIKFCTFYLSSIYLNIIKDRKYTTKKYSIPYYSAQTTMWMILESLAKWIAPILSFTAEEIWEYLPRKKSLSIYEETWFNKLFYLHKNNIINNDIWNILINIKNEYNKKLEKNKIQYNINSSLQTEIIIYIKEKILNKIKKIKSELKFFFITSKTTIKKNYYNNSIFKIKIKKIKGTKCKRCWHYVNKKKIIKKLNICNRCELNIFGKGENRKFI